MRQVIAILSIALVACGPVEQKPRLVIDQEVRRQVFMDCLDRAPAGPEQTKYNDWDEVVSECAFAAQEIATNGADTLPASRDSRYAQDVRL